jgi:hypothetical protein
MRKPTNRNNMTITFSFLAGLLVAIIMERVHYQPKAIRRAVEAVEDEATRNAARQFEIWKGVWLKSRPTLGQEIGRILRSNPPKIQAFDYEAALRRLMDAQEEILATYEVSQPAIQFPKKPTP